MKCYICDSLESLTAKGHSHICKSCNKDMSKLSRWAKELEENGKDLMAQKLSDDYLELELKKTWLGFMLMPIQDGYEYSPSKYVKSFLVSRRG